MDKQSGKSKEEEVMGEVIGEQKMEKLVPELDCEISWEERLRNDLFCVKWDVKS